MAPRARPPDVPPRDTPAPELTDTLERDVRAALAIPLTRLAAGAGLSRRGIAALHEALVARGLERTPRALRVPLREQLRARLREAPRVPVKAVPKLLKGLTNAGEAARAVREFLAAGEARLVVAGATELLAAPDTATLDAGQHRAIAALADTLAKSLRAARKRTHAVAHLALDDVCGLLRDALQQLPVASPPGPLPRPALSLADLQTAVCALETTPGAPVFLPDVLTRFASTPLAHLHAVLLDGAGRGALELRPESGVSLLSPEHAALCPRGVDGMALSYVRVPR